MEPQKDDNTMTLICVIMLGMLFISGAGFAMARDKAIAVLIEYDILTANPPLVTIPTTSVGPTTPVLVIIATAVAALITFIVSRARQRALHSQ